MTQRTAVDQSTTGSVQFKHIISLSLVPFNIDYLVRMQTKVQYEKMRVSFNYLGKHYSGDIVCSNEHKDNYWFVFTGDSTNLIGDSVEFKMVDGVLQPVQDFPDHKLFVMTIKAVIEKHLAEICS